MDWIFLNLQCYESFKSVMDQYKRSAILLEQHDLSSKKRTKYINVRYYFIVDIIEKGELELEYCPTDKMMTFFYRTTAGN